MPCILFQSTENVNLATLALAFEGKPHEVFGKSDASIAKGREMGEFVTDFKRKYNGVIDWQKINLGKMPISLDSDVIEPTLQSISSRRNYKPKCKRCSSSMSRQPSANRCKVLKPVKSEPDDNNQRQPNTEKENRPKNQTFKIATGFKGAKVSLEIA